MAGKHYGGKLTLDGMAMKVLSTRGCLPHRKVRLGKKAAMGGARKRREVPTNESCKVLSCWRCPCSVVITDFGAGWGHWGKQKRVKA